MRVTVPDDRKFEIYHAVETELLSRRVAAQRFGISPTRVQQIVSEVQHFIAQHGGKMLLGMPAERLEVGALNLCHEKLQFFYYQVMRQWHAEIDHTGNSVRLLQAAARLAIEQAKLAGRIAKVRLAMQEAGTADKTEREFAFATEEESVTAARESLKSPQESSDEPELFAPPAGGCTDQADLAHQAEFQSMLCVLAKNDAVTSCDAITAAVLQRGATKASKNTPAQLRAR